MGEDLGDGGVGVVLVGAAQEALGADYVLAVEAVVEELVVGVVGAVGVGMGMLLLLIVLVEYPFHIIYCLLRRRRS